MSEKPPERYVEPVLGPVSPSASWDDGALPFTGGAPGRLFVLHAVIALAGLVTLDVLIASYAPAAVKQIGSSYQIQYYHVPAAILTYAFYFATAVMGGIHLATRRGSWDRRARAAGAVGLLANAVVLLTGSVWAKTAWDHWWVWDDPRLLTSAVQFLVWLGYALIQHAAEEDERRARFAAVYSIVALCTLPLTHFAVTWFGTASHPEEVKQKTAGGSMTLAAGMLAFLVFYLLLYRWKYDLDTAAARAAAALGRLRRLEERP